MKVIVNMSCCGGRRTSGSADCSTSYQVPGILQEALFRGLELHITLLVPLCRKFIEYLGNDMFIQHQIHFQTAEVVKA